MCVNFHFRTENVGMIAGLGMASALVADNIHKYQSHMESVRDYMETLLKVYIIILHF